MKKPNLLLRVCSLIIIVILFIQQSGFAQVAEQVNIAGYLSGIKNNFTQDKFRPVHLRYLQYLPVENGFKLLLDRGDQFIDNREQSTEYRKKQKNGQLMVNDLQLNQETEKLMEYFSIGLRLANESFWVNLRPDSPENIIDDYLSQTDVGRVMLETDLQLKKDLAKMTSPETAQGRIYWDRLYKKAEELFGYENVTIPTLTRPWIVPGEVIISETADSAYIYKATLKVMLEEDYLKSNTAVGEGLASSRNKNINNSYEFKDQRMKELNTYSTQLIKELIIPKLTQEVNSSKRYAQLKQVYYSLIMAQWFKSRFGPRDIINSGNLTGLTSKTPWNKQTYFEQYQKSFKDGEYNIQEPVRTPAGQVIRSYFSGGEMLNLPDITMTGDIPKTNAASPLIVSLPTVSSAVSYDPEKIFFREAKLGAMGLEITAEGQNPELSQQAMVSSSMEQKSKTTLSKKIFLLAIAASLFLNACAYIKHEPTEEKRRSALRTIYIENLWKGANGVPNLPFQEYLPPLDSLFLLFGMGDKKAREMVEDYAKSKQPAFIERLITLALARNEEAIEILRIPELKNNKKVQETLKELGLSPQSSINSKIETNSVEIKEKLLDPNTIESFVSLWPLKVPHGQRSFRTEEEHIFNILKVFYLLYDSVDFKNKEKYSKEAIEERIVCELYTVADKIGLRIITPQDITAGKYSVSESIEVKGDLIVLVDKEGILLTLSIYEVWNFRAEEKAFSEIRDETRKAVQAEMKPVIESASKKRDDALKAAKEKKDRAVLAASKKRDDAYAAVEAKRDKIRADELKKRQGEKDCEQKAEEAAVNACGDEIMAADSTWYEEYVPAMETYKRQCQEAGEEYNEVERVVRERENAAAEKDWQAQKEFVKVLIKKGKLNLIVVESLNPANEESLELNNGSSPVGGIDFTSFPIITRAVSNLNAGGVSMDRLLRVDIGREWQEIARMASSGIKVSPERLKEYVQASCAQDVMDRDKVLLCISDRLEQEEECGLPAEPLVIDMLAVLQSTNSQVQLRDVFVGN